MRCISSRHLNNRSVDSILSARNEEKTIQADIVIPLCKLVSFAFSIGFIGRIGKSEEKKTNREIVRQSFRLHYVESTLLLRDENNDAFWIPYSYTVSSVASRLLFSFLPLSIFPSYAR